VSVSKISGAQLPICEYPDARERRACRAASLVAPLPRTLSGDAFGLISEYFRANFASAEGGLGGEFFRPQSIVA
jgi:hypothetical protein